MFKTLDTPARIAAGWRGVDYLGDEWPPAHWYPPQREFGGTLAGWLEVLSEESDLLHRDAIEAVARYGLEALSDLEKMLASDNEFAAIRATVAIRDIAREADVPLELLDRVKQVVSQSTVRFLRCT